MSDREAVDALLARTRKVTTVHPLCAAQVAVARDGELLLFETFGQARFDGERRDATNESLFAIYSVTKALTSAAGWILLQEGALRLADRVVDHVPDFGSHGKEKVTIEQLLTHTAGFPSPRFPNVEWPEPAARLRHFARWKLEWEPGSRFVYHPTSSMWVFAELISRAAGMDYRDFVRTRICDPLDLGDLVIGLPAAAHARAAEVVAVGQAPDGERRAAAPVDAPPVDDGILAEANTPASREAGSPAGGAFATARDVAMFYQGILADGAGAGPGIWQREAILDAWTVRNPDFVDPMTGHPALRGLGVVVAGTEGKLWRGFAEGCSPRAFGHMGAGGQVSWADPETGLSFAFLTNGAHRDAARQGAIGFRLSTLAVALDDTR